MAKGSIVQKRGNKDSRYIVVDDERVGGKRKQSWTTIKRLPKETDRKFEGRAEAQLRAILGKRDNGEAISAGRDTVSEYLTNRWLPEYVRPNLGGRTIDSYEGLINKHIVPVIGTIQLRALKPLDVQRVYTIMRTKPGRSGKKLSGTSALHAHRVLRKALAQAVKWQLVSRNVADAVEAPRDDTKKREVAPFIEALPLVLEAADATEYGALARTLAWTGMRIGEALGLRWQDVDFDANRLRVAQTYGTDRQFREPKSATSRRTITLDQEIANVLREHKRKQTEHYLANGFRPEHDLVFADKLGQPTNHFAVERTWRKIIRGANTPGFRLHDLRHCHATLLLDRQTPLNVVQERLGHAQASTTANIYGHALSRAHDEAAGVMSRVLGGQRA